MTSTPSQPPTAAFKVRPARRGDATPIVALLQELGVKSDPTIVAWIINHPEMELMVAADQHEKVIGFATLSHRPVLKTGGRSASIDELIVAQAWQRKGVGRALLRKVVERARVLSVSRLEVQSFSAPSEAVGAFFAACGFERADVGTYRLK